MTDISVPWYADLLVGESRQRSGWKTNGCYGDAQTAFTSRR